MQLTHAQVDRCEPPFRVTMVCCGISSPANAGGLFRLADATGVDKMIFSPPLPNFESERLKRTSRETHTWVPYSIEYSVPDFLQECRAAGKQIIALELATGSIPINDLKLKVEDFHPVLVLGNERHGVPEDCLELADVVCHVPMYGRNSSMNVVSAASIALFTLLHSGR